jgi:hypothetical protein
MTSGFEISDKGNPSGYWVQNQSSVRICECVNDVTFSENYITYKRVQKSTFRSYNFALVYQELSIR